MVRETLGWLVKWGFFIAIGSILIVQGTQSEKAAAAVENVKLYMGVIGMSGGAMVSGTDSLVDGYRLTQPESTP